ncbi:glycosyltransferase [Streptomyces lonegramiae]|uniref:Glycosyltransferase n=1 Tax=Streptomyces lonegramiae TaxID=3075524 RepID=A0ABU2XRJ9_9ACTN|nr:glycosyltransferase [Streptomyces sp. DSM 41529]MDT0547690.1 glycosyltransferase [Streptomyces sp. DSM 41529]
MKIGYSFWGFLGSGVVDTPDGGRSHRRPFINALARQGHQLVFLQADRDRSEANDVLGYAFDAGLPDLDVLFLEWRWPIPGRNTTVCGSPSHTCDLHRQDELLQHYTIGHRVPTIIWDKDRRLRLDDAWRQRPGVVVCEATLDPTPGATSLLFPADDQWLDSAAPHALTAAARPLTLAYVGNQYDRDDEFDRYFAPAAGYFPHAVAGKWPDTCRWPHVAFLGRLGFPAAMRLYSQTLATVLLLPQRYARAGQITQRIFEAVLAGCLPLCPAEVRHSERFIPEPLLVRDGSDVVRTLRRLHAQAGTAAHTQLLADCIARLEPFRLSTQVRVLSTLLDTLVGSGAAR